MKKTLKVKGMHCRSCEMIIAEALEEAGAGSVAASHAKGEVTVDFGSLDEQRVRKIIKEEGYEVE